MADDIPTPEEIDAATREVYAAALDMNSELIKGIHKQVANIEVIRQAYLVQADRCTDIIKLLLTSAVVVADSTGSLLLNEFGFEMPNASDGLANEFDDDDED